MRLRAGFLLRTGRRKIFGRRALVLSLIHISTHLSIIDAEGNAVSMTNTLGTYFGCAVAVDGWGFLLDNQLHDFSIGEWAANAPGPGKRPRSSMTPTCLLYTSQYLPGTV